MKSKLKIAAVALMLGTATVAAAQMPTRAQTFADQLQQWQALTSAGTYAFHTPPVIGGKLENPVGNESFADRFARMQAEASSASKFKPMQPMLTAQAVDPEGKELFAQRFAEMQAHSSNSGEFGFQPGTRGTLVATTAIGNAVPSNVVASQQ
jgi:hypothetical protein